MKCPYLKKWVTFTCQALDRPYFPTAFQLNEYCKKKEHQKCPFFSLCGRREDLEDAIQMTRA